MKSREERRSSFYPLQTVFSNVEGKIYKVVSVLVDVAYIYKKVIGGRPYYYLRISERQGTKVVTKDVAYLGNDIAKLEGVIHKLPSKYKEEIRKGHKNIKRFIDTNYYLSKVGKLKKNPYVALEVLREVEAAKLHFEQSFSRLDKRTQRDLYENFLIDFAYNTTSIEGNTITLEEAAKLLRENLTPKEKTVREIFDLQNTKKVFFWLLDEEPSFSQNLIIKVHDMLLENIDIRKGYRTRDIRVFKSHFKASPGKYVQTDMNLLMKWYRKHQKLHPLVLVSLFHQKFEKIHPFYDGNGRTGRIIMNYLLLKLKYPPVIIEKKKRSEYLHVLSKGDKAGLEEANPEFFKELVSYVARELVESYWNNFNI